MTVTQEPPTDLSSSTKHHLIALACAAACVATLSIAAPRGVVATHLNASIDAGQVTTEAPAHLSDGVDWSLVKALPADTGMSIAAYGH